MTPFGARVRQIRSRQGLTQQAFAARLGVSAAYVSALEHGKRGKPGFALVQAVIHALGVIWDEADELVRLAELSDPRVVIDTAGLDPQATLLANRLARHVAELDPAALAALHGVLDEAARERPQTQATPDHTGLRG